MHDVLTPDSLAAFNAVKSSVASNAPSLFAEYDTERKTHLAAYPNLSRWNHAIENFDFATASDPSLLGALAAEGFLGLEEAPSGLRPDAAVIRYKLIAPKIVDAFLTATSAMKVAYAFNSLHVCFRRAEVPTTVQIPKGWRDTILVNCEIFELPYRVATDDFDDREKIHVYYLAGMQGDQFRAEPIYIGIGTGEAYGLGPANRTSCGRFRFYRYDIKENFQYEFIEFQIVREWTEEGVQDLPNYTRIDSQEATLLLGRGATDASFMCLSDPIVAANYRTWIAADPRNRLVFRQVKLQKRHEDLAARSCDPPASEGRLETALARAEEIHRHFFAAWQHPSRLTATEGLQPYYDELPDFRRAQYEIYRIKPQYLGQAAPADGMSIPAVLFDEFRRSALDHAAPEAVLRLESWLQPQVIEDLYHFGNHPELRLCSALVFMRLLRGNGLWAEAIRATYDRRLNFLDFTVSRLVAPP